MKPPNSWLKEYAAKEQQPNNESSKESSKAFKDGEDNTFRNYMSRKIELQRNQFGLILPPDPNLDPSIPVCGGKSDIEDVQLSPPKITKVIKDASLNSPIPSSIRDSSKGEYLSTPKSVRFDEESIATNDSGGTDNPMHGLLKKLKRKHGLKGSKRKLRPSRKRKRDKSLHVENHEHEEKQLEEKQLEEKIIEHVVPRDKIYLSSSSSHDSGTSTTDKNDQINIQKTAKEGNNVMEVVPQISIKRTRKDLFFYGVVVLVNGYTEPSADMIMRDLHKHGGDLEKYETNRVTHIIAQNLSTAKANIYKKQKKPTPVVRPQWIVDCVQAQRLLPHAEYLLTEVRDDNAVGSKSVLSYYKDGREEQEKTISDKIREINDSTTRLADSDYRGKILIEKSQLHEHKLKGLTKAQQSLPTSGPEKVKENYSRQKTQGTVGTDPNFLESYFNHSRLSFIGSFKQRSHSDTRMAKQNHEKGAIRFVFHVDMDCFFASVAIRNYPQFKDAPVAVGHATNIDSNGQFKHVNNKHMTNSNSELSTCNYVARKFGVKKGMFLHRAISLCPDLVVLPYDYEGYDEVAQKTAEILLRYSELYDGSLEQVSCDEAYLEIYLTHTFQSNPMNQTAMSLSELVRSIGENIRGDIIAETQCTVTIGIGENKLLAKLGADKVKQNGGNNLLHVKDSESFMQNVKLRELPGIGYKLGKKLHSKNLLNVQDILDYGDEGKIQLTTILGPGNGTKLFNYCRGKDDRRVEASPRKTIGAECNYGVRFDGPYGVDHMVMGLSTEVEKRMESVGVLGKNITVKIKQRKPNAPPPGKFNGHGPCFDHSKSANLPTNTATRDASLISVQAMELFDALCIEKDDIRGMGIVISKLESANSSSVLHGGMEKWLDDKSFKRDRNENCTSASSNIQSNQKSETPGCIDKEPLGNNTAKEVHEPSNHQKVRIQSTHTREETSTSNNGKATRIRTKKKPTSRPPRQNDVKRMFKLASVKAGLDQISINGDPVSLTQLDSLPLDVQLQVANHDNIRARMNGMKTQNASTTVIELSDSDDSVIAYESSIAEGPLQCDEGSNFYQSNILPFRKYLDASMEPSEEDVRKVRTFLHICFDEKRLDDLVMYLRIIKQRKNDWGTIHYPTILREVVEIAKKKEGRNLDLVSLGLT